MVVRVKRERKRSFTQIILCICEAIACEHFIKLVQEKN